MEGNSQVIFATTVFLVAYAIIISEKIHRTVVALFGAMILIIAGVLHQERAVEAIDFNTIGLLVGMMIIVGITRRSGVFEYLAVKAAKQSKGEPLAILVALSVITAVLSALLDNVTTVLLIVPVTFSIARALEINPMPILISEVLSSNIGGTATLIGDPPNIMIGSAVGLGFMDFVVNLAPVVIVIMVVTIYLLKWIYRKEFVVREELKQNILAMNENDEIKDAKLLKKALFVLALTIGGFLLHQYAHLESATIALAGAALLLLLTGEEPEHALEAVEWPVIFFFAGLFILVGGLEEVGVIEWIAAKALEITGGELLTTGMLILWLSAIASAFVDNIPFVATMIPLIQDMGRLGGMTNLDPLWWSLALGACLGGNGTIIGASANVVVVGMAEKQGMKFTFLGFMKVAFPLMIVSIIISSTYLYFFYLT
ncbi:possible tyrosine transporter P-protein [Desulforamulus reducens MI-1]|uniref:Possible tyrosine transporter P-protein n=1 Tax=Desulforamulus reducens (strain ATCC BAA-1160 / DSM 100696 / MI-1) TaxID=349161 RepID=A4J602_DESRM|nr:ArsB/NhaD family transporter [Desulforamulus reducens]ABO50505.1 possible tyrosine transporter P-protein [Desulforamulus reducens MI-1]